MFCAKQRRLLAFSLLLMFGTVISGSAQQGETPPLRVLVKVTGRFAKVVEAALPADTLRLSKAAPSNIEIDAFLKAHSVRRLTPLYPDIVRAKKLRGLSDAQFAAAVQRTFPQRASRWRRAFNPPEISRTYVLEIDNGADKDLQQMLQGLRADANVEFAEEDHVIRVRDLPNDPFFWSTGTWGQSYDDLWGIKKIGAPAAWGVNAGDGVVVAIVDTGIDYNHADIAANIWTNTNEIAGNGVDDDGNGYADDVRGWDFVGARYQFPAQSNNPVDGYGHGTHVAGTIAALGNNGIGVIGVAWQAKVMAVKGLDNYGYGTDSTLAPAIIYAADNGADVISNSWAGTGSSQAIAEAVQYAYSLGAVIVAAAGNDTDDARNYYPANLPQVITVAATNANDAKAYFSNWGSKIDVAAPGVDILSLRAANTTMGTVVGTDYTRADGTSMATPHVSGAAALILSQHPDYSNEDVRQVLRVSTDLSSGSFDTFFGYGRLNAANALAVASVLEAKILEPVDGSVVSVPTTISGVARGNGFASYSLEYGVGEAPFSWTQLQSGTSPVSGSLGTFDPTRLMNGVYTLRLTAYDIAGHAFVDRMQVTARAISISSPVPPLVPTTATVLKPGVTVAISGTAIGGNFQSYRLEWAAGINPADGWSSAGITLNGDGLSPVTNDVLGTWDTSAITQAGYYTIRLTVDNVTFGAQTATLVYLEPSLLSSGWPVWLDHAPDTSRSGIVPASDAAGISRLTLFKPGDPAIPTFTQFRSYGIDGSLLTAFDLVGYPVFQPVAGDLDGLAGDEVIVPELYSLRWFGSDNTSIAMPAQVPNASAKLQNAQLIMEDLDGDSELETIGMGVASNSAAYIFAWRRDGTQMNANFPITLPDLNANLRWNNPRVLVGDIDSDGKKEIIAVEGTTSSSFTLRLFENDGTPRAWNAPTMVGIYDRMVLADLDHNGKLETLLLWRNGSQKQLDILQPDGTERPGWPVLLRDTTASFLAVGDLNRDGNEEIVVSNYSGVYVLNTDGTSFSNAWPRWETNWDSVGPVVLADIDGDGYPEILTVMDRFLYFSGPLFNSTNAGVRSVEAPVSRTLQTYIDADGTAGPPTVRTTPVAQSGNTFYYAPQLIAFRLDTTIARSWDLLGSNGNQPYAQGQLTVGDFNHDGLTEIAAVYQLISGGGTSGYIVEGVATLLATSAPYNPAVNDWPMFLQNARNTAVRIHDVTAPAVRITSPADGSVLCGTVPVAANATDNIGVAGVQLQLDGANLGPELTGAPYQFVWDTTTASLGAHTLTAVARDSAGNVAASAGVNVTIFPPMPATVSPTALSFGDLPLNSTSTPQTVTVTNTGGQPLPLALAITADFAQTSDCGSVLDIGARCVVSVTFTPAVRGAATGTLSVTSQGFAPLVVSLSGTGLVTNAELSPTSVDFGGQALNTASAWRSITFSNTGDTRVTIASVATTGEFVQVNNCGNSLAAGTRCTISVTFRPTARGAASGTLSVTGTVNATAALSGTGQAKSAAVSPTSLSFGFQQLNTTSAPQTVTYTNTGDLPLSISAISETDSYASSFAQSNDCGTSLAVGASCSINVTFTPRYRGYLIGTLSISGDAPGSVSLSGTGQGMAAVLSPTSFNFGSVPLNTTSAPKTFTYTNAGDFPLSISAISATGNFAQTNNCGASLAVGASCAISATFSPTARGVASGRLSVTGSVNATASLSGTGLLLTATFSPTSLNFGNQEVNTTSAPLSLTVTNNGDGSFYINSLGYSVDFSPTSNCMGYLGVGASCTMQVTFRPTSMSSKSSELSVGGTFTGSPAKIPLSGTGVISPPSLTPNSLAFGNQLLNTTSAPQNVTVTNTAKVAVTIGSIQVSGDFAQTNNCPGSLPVGGSCAVSLTFTPKTRGAGTATLTVNGTFTGTSVSVPLTGTGQAMLATTLPSSLSFGGQLLNTTTPVQAITYTNTGDVPISVSAISTTGSFAQNNNCATLAVGESCSINVTFTPTVRGVQSGTLSISGSVNSNVALSGTGQIISGAVSPTSLGFGGQLLSTTSQAQAVTYTNNGDVPLSISAISVSGDFAQTNNCGTSLPVGSSCTISVTFTPSARGTVSGTLSINGTASSSAALTGTGQIVAATLAPASLTFAGQQLNTTSPPQALTYTNTGDVPVSLSAISVTGSFAQTNNCGTSLAVGASCAINVTFTPTARGSAVGALSVSGSLDSSVALSGTGQIISGVVAPASLSFGGQQLNTTSPPQVLTYTNSGDLPVSISGVTVSGSFAQNNDCPTSLATGASCTINVTFTPSIRGAASGTLAISGDANASVSLSGTGQAVIAAFSPTALAFGNQEVNTTSAPQSVTLVNSGDLPFSIQSWNWGGPFPTVTDCPASLAAGTRCTFDVTFVPTTVGTVPGTSLTINGTFPGSPATITLSGTGIVSPPSLSPNLVAFGNQLLNTTSAAQTVVLTNMSRSVVGITAIQVAGQFAQTNNCGTSLAVGDSCAIYATFTPTVAGDQSGTLTITGAFTGTSVTATLTGKGVLAPIASVSPSTLTFASRVVNTTSGAQAVSLSNTGKAALTITSISASGDFAQTSNCGATLAVNATCKINVTFTPASAGARTGAVTIVDNSYTGSPQIVSLSGTGLDYAISVSPSSATVTAGQYTTATVTVTALGGSYNSSVSLKCSGLPPSTTCSFSPSSVSPKSTFASSVLKISTVAGETPPGDYMLTITGTSGKLLQSTALSLTVN